MPLPMIRYDASNLSENECALLDLICALVPLNLALATTAHEVAGGDRPKTQPLNHDDYLRALERVLGIVKRVLPHLNAYIGERAGGSGPNDDDLLN